MVSVGEKIRPVTQDQLHGGFKVARSRVENATSNVGRAVGERTGKHLGKGLMHVIFPTVATNPRSRVASIEGRRTRHTAEFLRTTSNLFEGSGAALLAAGTVLLNPPIILTGAVF